MAGAGERLTSRRRGRGPGRPKPRSRAFNSLGAKAEARGGAPETRSSGQAGTHCPSGLRPRAPPGRSGSRGASSPLLRAALLLPPPLPGLASSSDADSGGSPEEAGPPSPQPGTASSQGLFSPPPLLSPKRSSRLQSSPLKPTWRRRGRR